MATTATQPTQHSTSTTKWMRLARASAITMAVWAVLLHLMAQTIIPPVIVVGLIFAWFTPFLAGERRRLGLAYWIVAALALFGNAPVIIDELAHANSAPSFVLTLLSVAAALTAIVAGLGAFFRWSTSFIRRIAIAAVTIFGIGALTSIAMFATTESAIALENDVQVVAEKVEYVPGDITLAKADSGIWIDNNDGIHHTFTVTEIDVDLDIPALKAARVDIDAAPGTYTYVCTVPGHENMTGTLTISG